MVPNQSRYGLLILIRCILWEMQKKNIYLDMNDFTLKPKKQDPVHEFIQLEHGWHILPSVNDWEIVRTHTKRSIPLRYCKHEHHHNISSLCEQLIDALTYRQELPLYVSTFLIPFYKAIPSRKSCCFCKKRDEHFEKLVRVTGCCTGFVERVYMPFDNEILFEKLQDMKRDMDALRLRDSLRSEILDTMFAVIIENIDTMVQEVHEKNTKGCRYRRLKNELYTLFRDRKCYIRLSEIDLMAWCRSMILVIGSSDASFLLEHTVVSPIFIDSILTEFLMVTMLLLEREACFTTKSKKMLLYKMNGKVIQKDVDEDILQYHPLVRGSIIRV